MHSKRSHSNRGKILPSLGLLVAAMLLSAQTWAIEIERAKWEAGDDRLVVKIEKAGRYGTVVISNANLGGVLGTFTADKEGKLEAEIQDPSPVPCRVRAESGGASDERNVSRAPADCDRGGTPPPPGGGDEVSINSTSQNCGQPGEPACSDPIVEQPLAGTGGHSIVAINDLGMHCGDLDTRIASILPPFQVLLAQVIQKGSEKGSKPRLLGPNQAEVFYSAASNPNDPALALGGQTCKDPQGNTEPCVGVYKTNFWDYPIPLGSYDPFYPAGLTPLVDADNAAINQRPVAHDVGLPVPNVERLYIQPDGTVVPNFPGTGDVWVAQQDMPGITAPYVNNEPQHVEEHISNKPFFPAFPFGYIADNVNWHEGAGIPFAAYDDFGRENAYPLVRVQAKSPGGNVLATVDTVLPISGEASCKNCHADPLDPNFVGSRTGVPTATLENASLPVANSDEDPQFGSVPTDVSVEWATDINVLRLHDQLHGDQYVAVGCSSEEPGSCIPTPCTIDAANPNGDGPHCLTYQALVGVPDENDVPQPKPIVCQVCHYTPALDLAQVGPLAGPEGDIANGRNQLAHQSNSRVMHNHHGQFTDLFPPMPLPVQGPDPVTGEIVITNQGSRESALSDSCYQCHPGEKAQCLRGAMFNGGMLCNDCHGDMSEVGNDFTADVSPSSPGPASFVLGGGNFYDHTADQPRVPWANEPGCGSCHTGNWSDNALTSGLVSDAASGGDAIVNLVDTYGNPDNLRLRVAYRVDLNAPVPGPADPKATPIVPTNTQFAENPIPASFNGFNNPGAGNVGSTGAKNPKLYRVSTGHGGVFCEGCHGATHAEWPNGYANANDNVTASQLQGHTGTIIECSTCHTGDLGNTLDGPHGMHPVGNVSFVDGGHEHMAKNNPEACATCHGDQGQGTVLSVAKTDRNLPKEHGSVFVAKGTPIDCGLCHSNPYTDDHH